MADLTVAVEVGMALAALLYIYRVTDTTIVSTLTQEDIEDGRAHILQDKDVPAVRDDPADPRAVPVRDDRQARPMPLPTCRRSHPSSSCGCAT